jgi:hypothetical protein
MNERVRDGLSLVAAANPGWVEGGTPHWKN